MKNQDIRAEIKSAGFRLWQVAEKLGMQDSTFSRKLRHELSAEEKTCIRSAIQALTTAKEEN